MAIGFMKRLFGGGAAADPIPVPSSAEPAAISVPPSTEPDPHAGVDEARAAARRIRRFRDPLEWAEAQQLLGNALIHLAGTQTGASAIATYEEAESVLSEAIAAAGPDANPGFLASLTNLHGYAAFCRGERLAGDGKVRAYGDAVRRFTNALAKITPETQRVLWVDLGFYRGTALQSLSSLQDDAEAAVSLDEAAASFRAIAEHGTGDRTVHPIAAYNLYVVLQNRARLAAGRAALPSLTEARQALLQAMEAPAFEASRADHQSRLAVLDAAISAARG